MARLAELKNIVGVKDCTELSRTPRQRAAFGDDFIMLSGDDITALAYMAQSGTGCISVTANVAPRHCAEMHAAWRQGDVKRAQAINARLAPLHDAMFVRVKSGAGKVRGVTFGQIVTRCAAADRAGERERTKDRTRRDDECGVAQLTQWLCAAPNVMSLRIGERVMII